MQCCCGVLCPHIEFQTTVCIICIIHFVGKCICLLFCCDIYTIFQISLITAVRCFYCNANRSVGRCICSKCYFISVSLFCRKLRLYQLYGIVSRSLILCRDHYFFILDHSCCISAECCQKLPVFRSVQCFVLCKITICDIISVRIRFFEHIRLFFRCMYIFIITIFLEDLYIINDVCRRIDLRIFIWISNP